MKGVWANGSMGNQNKCGRTWNRRESSSLSRLFFASLLKLSYLPRTCSRRSRMSSGFSRIFTSLGTIWSMLARRPNMAAQAGCGCSDSELVRIDKPSFSHKRRLTLQTYPLAVGGVTAAWPRTSQTQMRKPFVLVAIWKVAAVLTVAARNSRLN